MEFRCIKAEPGNPLFFLENTEAPAKAGVQQLYFTKHEYNNDTTPSNIENFIKYTKGRFYWTDVRLKEIIIVLKNSNKLNVYGRNEKYEDSEYNYVDGKADKTSGGNGAAGFIGTLGEEITDIQYLFWGKTSKSWNNSGNGENTPITEWDSTATNPPHELPLAMKIILRITFNPVQKINEEFMTQEEKDSYHKKDQNIILEKVVVFKNRN